MKWTLLCLIAAVLAAALRMKLEQTRTQILASLPLLVDAENGLVSIHAQMFGREVVVALDSGLRQSWILCNGASVEAWRASHGARWMIESKGSVRSGVEFCKRPRNATVGTLKFADRTELRLYNASAEIVIGKSIKVSLENLGRVEGVKEFGNAVGSFESANMKGAIGLAPGGAFLRELCGVLPAVVASLSIPRREFRLSMGRLPLGGPGIPLESPTEESYWKTQARCRLYLGEGDDVFVEAASCHFDTGASVIAVPNGALTHAPDSNTQVRVKVQIGKEETHAAQRSSD